MIETFAMLNVSANYASPASSFRLTSPSGAGWRGAATRKRAAAPTSGATSSTTQRTGRPASRTPRQQRPGDRRRGEENRRSGKATGVAPAEFHNEVEQFCRDALAEHAKLFRLWHKLRNGRIDRRQLVLRSIPIQKRLFALGERHLDSSHRDVGNLAAALFEHIERLSAFVDYEGVEPTNNSAERALRTGVQWRKTSIGNRSASGELATARLLTVTETCDIQKLNILAYLSAAISSHRRRQTPPSLLPR
jgi:hypothetical protein